MSARQHPRFLDAQRVEVCLENREELREMWTQDISKGGMFIRTDAPPAFGTMLDIVLETPGGNLTLKAEVVHVLPPEQAQQIGYPAGVGVQFSALPDEVKTQIESYVDQVAERLSMDTPDVSRPSAEEILRDTKSLMERLAQSDIYAALEVPPSATDVAIGDRVKQIRGRFSNLPPDMPPPQVARVEHVLRQVERAARLFEDPMRRLHYDFRLGHIRFEERKAAGQDLHKLRQVWCESRPDQASRAKLLAEQAAHAQVAGDLERAAFMAEKALENDPFNEPLREAVMSWKKGQQVDLEEEASPAPTRGAPPTRGAVPTRGASSPAATPAASASQEAPIEILDPVMILDPVEVAGGVKEEPPVAAELRELAGRMDAQDHFEVLGIKLGATAAEAQLAFIQKAKKFHPDAFTGQSEDLTALAARVQARINEAHDVLRDATRRQAYLADIEAKRKDAEEASRRQAVLNLEMAKVHIRKTNYAEARTLLKEAMELDDKNLDLKATFAWSMLADPKYPRDEAYDRARPLLETAIEKTTLENSEKRARAAQYHYYLGRMFRERGDVQLALKHFQKTLALDSGHHEASTEVRLLRRRQEREGSKSGSKPGFKLG